MAMIKYGHHLVTSTLIAVKPEHLAQIRTHAESVYPEECCGLLLGTINQNDKKLLEVWPTENSWNAQSFASFSQLGASSQPASRRNRFRIAPEVMLAAQKKARDRHLKIIGIYHSHPDYQAIPSEFDRAIAWPSYSYVIVSVQRGDATDLGSWVLDANQKFQAEEITTFSEFRLLNK